MTNHDVKAVIVIGSNSTRMLTTDFEGREITRGREETRLFLSLGENCVLSPEGIESAVSAVRILKEKAAAAGAADIRLAATSAARDARNGGALHEKIKSETGLYMDIWSGEKEAEMSFFGAAGDMRAGDTVGVIDIGGGSTEIITGTRDGIGQALSLQMGAGRLYALSPIHGERDIALARKAAGAAMLPLPPMQAGRWMLAGGTGTALAGMKAAEKTGVPPKSAEGVEITREDVFRLLNRLAVLPEGERAGLPGVPESRADILPTGAAVLAEVMEALRLSSVAVTARTNMDGWLKTLYR